MMLDFFKDKSFTRSLLIHLLVWLIYVLYESLTRYFLAGLKTNLLEAVALFALNAALFYSFALFLLPRYFKKKKYLLFIIASLLAFGGFILLRFVFIFNIVPLLNDAVNNPFDSLKQFFAESTWRGTYFIMLSFGYWFAANLIEAEKEKRVLEVNRAIYERKMREAEKDLRIAQLEYLRNQINPHFLFNTLNFFYEQVINTSEKTAEAILLLSSIMRYALKENDINSKAMLQEEVNHLRNFIAIHQLRFGQRLQVKLEVSGTLNFKMILPLVLITFVENCFKYGDLFDKENPLLIRLEVAEDELYFFTSNKKKAGPVESSTGIGINNTRKRLDLIYKDRYTLELLDENNFFTTNLRLKL